MIKSLNKNNLYCKILVLRVIKPQPIKIYHSWIAGKAEVHTLLQYWESYNLSNNNFFGFNFNFDF